MKQGAAYHETAAKWMATQMHKLDDSRSEIVLSGRDFHDLVLVLMAQANCYRSEYASLLVAGSTNQDTQRFYRMFERKPHCIL